MWNYRTITREDFEKIKNRVEDIIISLGGEKIEIELNYEKKTTSYLGKDNNIVIENNSSRPAFEFGGTYYRVDEVCFEDRPFIVIECGTFEDLLNNTMEDAEPFPFDLSAEEIKKEVQYSLGIAGGL